jgi:hypothetical protein
MYGSVTNVASLSRVFTSLGVFSATTRPTDTEVTVWLTQISSTLDLLLAEMGFTVPITQATAKLALDAITEENAAEMVRYTNGQGRFFTDRMLERGKSPMQIIRAELGDWVQDHAKGFEALGVPRGGAAQAAGKILYRDADDSGNRVNPLFRRSDFGER